MLTPHVENYKCQIQNTNLTKRIFSFFLPFVVTRILVTLPIWEINASDFGAEGIDSILQFRHSGWVPISGFSG